MGGHYRMSIAAILKMSSNTNYGILCQSLRKLDKVVNGGSITTNHSLTDAEFTLLVCFFCNCLNLGTESDGDMSDDLTFMEQVLMKVNTKINNDKINYDNLCLFLSSENYDTDSLKMDVDEKLDGNINVKRFGKEIPLKILEIIQETPPHFMTLYDKKYDMYLDKYSLDTFKNYRERKKQIILNLHWLSNQYTNGNRKDVDILFYLMNEMTVFEKMRL